MPLHALLSVYHKEGIIEFARELRALDFNLIASGGTCKTLREAEVQVTDVAELLAACQKKFVWILAERLRLTHDACNMLMLRTSLDTLLADVGRPILGHRVVTLAREIHAALMSRDTAEDNAELERIGVPRVDLVCVDLYPLEDEIRRPESTPDSIIEMTDIGGPTLIRSAVKGRRIVVCDPRDRDSVTQWLKKGMPDQIRFITMLTAKAELVVARYVETSGRFLKAYVASMRSDGTSISVGENTLFKIMMRAVSSMGGSTPVSSCGLLEHDNGEDKVP